MKKKTFYFGWLVIEWRVLSFNLRSGFSQKNPLCKAFPVFKLKSCSSVDWLPRFMSAYRFEVLPDIYKVILT